MKILETVWEPSLGFTNTAKKKLLNKRNQEDKLDIKVNASEDTHVFNSKWNLCYDFSLLISNLQQSNK